MIPPRSISFREQSASARIALLWTESCRPIPYRNRTPLVHEGAYMRHASPQPIYQLMCCQQKHLPMEFTLADISQCASQLQNMCALKQKCFGDIFPCTLQVSVLLGINFVLRRAQMSHSRDLNAPGRITTRPKWAKTGFVCRWVQFLQCQLCAHHCEGTDDWDKDEWACQQRKESMKTDDGQFAENCSAAELNVQENVYQQSRIRTEKSKSAKSPMSHMESQRSTDPIPTILIHNSPNPHCLSNSTASHTHLVSINAPLLHTWHTSINILGINPSFINECKAKFSIPLWNLNINRFCLLVDTMLIPDDVLCTQESQDPDDLCGSQGAALLEGGQFHVLTPAKHSWPFALQSWSRETVEVSCCSSNIAFRFWDVGIKYWTAFFTEASIFLPSIYFWVKRGQNRGALGKWKPRKVSFNEQIRTSGPTVSDTDWICKKPDA